MIPKTLGSGSIRGFARQLLVTAFSVALIDDIAQLLALPEGNFPAMEVAYLVFPFLIFATFLAVYAYSYGLIRETLRVRSCKIASLVFGIGYGVFYLFATNMIQLNPDDLSNLPVWVLSRGYVIPAQVYGPMTLWPDVEFYFPKLNLFGYISIGSILLVGSLSLLAAFSAALLIRNLKVRRRAKQSTGFYAGAFATVLSTNNCCCCAPVLLPALNLFFGGAATGTLTYYLIVGPVNTLLVLGAIGSLLASILLSTRRACRAEIPGAL